MFLLAKFGGEVAMRLFTRFAGTIRAFWRSTAGYWLAGFRTQLSNESRHVREIERLEHQVKLAHEDVRTMAARLKYYQEWVAAETALQSRRIAESRGERR